MARTISEIETAMDATITDVMPTPSTSEFAEWKKWRNIMARAINSFEQIMDSFTASITAIIQTKQPGSFDWYNDRILEFQGGDESGTYEGDTLVVINGVVQYETPDTTRRLIAKSALASSAGIISVKVAKIDGATTYQKLTNDEAVAFGVYMNEIKYPGTQINISTADPDMIKYTLKIVYDPAFSTSTIETNVLAALETFRTSFGFDDMFYPSKMIQAILDAEGVVAVDNNGVEAKEDGGSYGAVDYKYQLVAGYFNYDTGASALTYESI